MAENGEPTSSWTQRISLRVNLVLWMVAIYLAVQLPFGLVMQLYFMRSINDVLNTRMLTFTREVVRDIRDDLPSIGNARLHQLIREIFGTVASDEYVLDVFSESGELVATSKPPGPSIQSDLLSRKMQSTEPEVTLLPGSILRTGNTDQPEARVAFVPMSGLDSRRYLLVASRKDTTARQMTALIWEIMLLNIPIGLIATSLSAYLVSGLAVRPFQRLVNIARALRPESITTQIPARGESREAVALQQELELARQRIESGFAVQERFMSNVSHELKTPLTVALTQLQLLKPDTLPVPVREAIFSITEELSKLGRTVDSFLLLTRVRHGKTIVEVSEKCYVRDIMLDSYESCTPFAGQYNVRLNLRLLEGDDLDCFVQGNCDLLRTVLDNLVRNAVRFSPPGQVVNVSAEVKEGNVLISVRDRGPGIPADILPYIFDRFVQAKSEEARGRGHGLGLAIAQGIAELHSGGLSVRNCEDGGCEFIVTLPVRNTEIPPPST